MKLTIVSQILSSARMRGRTATCVVCLLIAGCQHWQQPGAESYQDVGCQDCPDGSCEARLCVSGHCYSRCIDEHFATREAIRRANRSLRRCYSSLPSLDFRDGYRSAFIDIALGGSGEVPAVPPEKYWSTCFRTAGGHQRAQDWYAGYVEGAGRATSLCRYQHNWVETSGITPFVEESPDQNDHRPGADFPPSQWSEEVPPGW